MTKYEVTAWCSVRYYTTFELEAGSLTEALDKAKLQSREESGEPCGGEAEWDEFEITSGGDAAEHLRHLEPAFLASIAADGLLKALNEVLLALQYYSHWQPSMPGHLVTVVEAAINKATKT